MSPINTYAQPFFQPAMRFIADISLSNPMIVTTVGNHLYATGLTVRLTVPHNYKMTQADLITGEIIVLSPTTFSMPIDSTLFNSFSVPAGIIEINAQVVPFGENALSVAQAERNVLPY